VVRFNILLIITAIEIYIIYYVQTLMNCQDQD